MDIDIDISKPVDLKIPRSIFASSIENEQLQKHLVGIYLQNIATDRITGLSAIPYGNAERLGYYKIDILNLSLLSHFHSNDEIDELLKMEPDWEMLRDQKIVNKLFHIKNHYDIVKKCNPQSIEDLADILALIRPNKKGLIDKYIQNKKEIRKILYDKHDESDLRKSHALAYAMNIVLQMNLITLGAEF